MLHAVERALPADVAIFAAAVADWRVANAGEQKIKKKPGQATPELSLVENPDILSTIAHRKIAAAEAGDRLCRRDRERRRQCQGQARAPKAATGSSPTTCRRQTGIMGGDSNTIQLVTAQGIEPWPPQSKEDVAAMLIARIAEALDGDEA